MKKKYNKNQGFTLIEVSIALIIAGIILVPTLAAYDLFIENKKKNQTQENLSVISSALSKYVLRYGRYPRPAHPNVPLGNNAFGQEAAVATIGPCSWLSAGDTNVPACNGNAWRDAPGTPVADTVYVGTVPFAALGIPYRYALDYNKNKISYTVSEYMTRTGVAFSDANGVIGVYKMEGQPPATNPESDVAPPNSAHYVLIVHGENGMGASSLNGRITNTCNAANGRDADNCNRDGRFTVGVYWNVSQARWSKPIKSRAPGAEYYDDTIAYTNVATADIWVQSVGGEDILSRHNGDIRIGPLTGNPVTDNPKAKIDVNGDVRADRVQSSEICALGSCPSTVFTPAIIAGVPVAGGSGLKCANDRAMTGISQANEECSQDTRFSNPTAIAGCGAGTRAYGVTSTGALLCR